MDAVLEKTQDLAEAIRSSDSFVKLKQCEQRMKNSAAAEKANAEYEIFNKTQPIESDFDRVIKKMLEEQN